MKTKETQAKAQATREAKRLAFGQQTITIDADWKIRRFDQWNWEIRHKGRFYGYYGRVLDALRALYGKVVAGGANKSLLDVLNEQNRAYTMIEDAIKRGEIANALRADKTP